MMFTMMFLVVLLASMASEALSIDTWDAFHSQAETGESLACPVRCHARNIESCFNTTTTCDGQLEYCRLNLSSMGDIHGSCSPLTNHHTCIGEMYSKGCDTISNNINTPRDLHASRSCVLSCCASRLCMQSDQYNGLNLVVHQFPGLQSPTATPVNVNVLRPSSDLFASISVPRDILYCPVMCDVTDINACYNTTVLCDGSHNYCHLMLDAKGVIKGFCSQSDSNEHNTCYSEAVSHECRDMGSGGRSDCVLSCCQSQHCMTSSRYNGISYATQLFSTELTSTAPTPTHFTTMTTEPTTVNPTTTTISPSLLSLYTKYATSCQDQLKPGACATLKANGDVCHHVLSVDLCADTCGVCQVIAGANCHDIIPNNGCHDQYVARGMCDDPLARTTCPASCGLCDVMVNTLIRYLVLGRTTTLAPTGNPDVVNIG